MSSPIRIKPADAKALKRLKQSDEAKEAAVEEGIIDSVESGLTWEEVFLLIIPEDAEIMAISEDGMSWQDAGEAQERIASLAGENVSIHEVVTKYTNEALEEYEI